MTGCEKGYKIESRKMTTDEWGKKLNDDIGERPDYYYRQEEIPRLDSDLEECAQEIWQIQKTMREAQLNGWWFRTVGRDTCKYCPYFDLCSCGFDPAVDPVPDGFEVVADVHPELSREEDTKT